MPRCTIFNFSVLFLENRLVTPIRSPNQRGFARNGLRTQSTTGSSAGTGTGFRPRRLAPKSTPVCLHCSASFGYRTELISHVNEKHWSFKCQDCVKDPILAADRDNHRSDVHTATLCNVPQCKVFKINSDELHQHKRDAHWDVFRFRCCVRPCYNVFKDRDMLMDHLFKVHGRGLARTKGQIPSYECDLNEPFNQLVCLFTIPANTGRTSASARSVRGDLLRGNGSSTTA